MNNPAPLVLKRIDAARNMQRFYILSVEPAFFTGYCLVRAWGRIGTRGRSRIELHACRQDAETQLQRLADAKRRRGYREDADHTARR